MSRRVKQLTVGLLVAMTVGFAGSARADEHHDTTLEAKPTSRDCWYAGQRYSTGSTVNQAGIRKDCVNGQWYTRS